MEGRERIAKVVAEYHEMLERSYLDSTVELLDDAIRRRGLSVAGRPVCSVLRPQFLDSGTYSMVMRASTLVMKGFSELAQRLLQDASLRARMELAPEEDAIVTIDTGYGAADVSARLDGFLDAAGNFRFVEYNADSPGGLAFGDVLAEVFASTPLVQEFRRRHPFHVLPTRSRTFDALVSCYRRWGGRGLFAWRAWRSVGAWVRKSGV